MKNELKSAVILCNGQPPDRAQIVHSLKKADLFIAADGGGNTARAMNISPDIVIGDLDSYKPEKTDPWKVIERPNQNFNDLEKALDYAHSKGIADVVVYGATGLRLDHTVKNLSVLKQYHTLFDSIYFRDLYCDVKLIDSPFRENFSLHTEVSLFPLSGIVRGVTSRGLKYNLSNDTLENGIFDGSSNLTVAPRVEITFDSGDLLFFINHKTDSKSNQ
ncbi:thiamine diphosphokinase [Rhodohalobacter sp. 8-1]|uniref:thiamine diphosphokinase n=1 Tax=Rhodohalobacter sp. 8-1 TaxID=3131972 RepID=UPI0030EC8C17